jgi:hypothetical protein
MKTLAKRIKKAALRIFSNQRDLWTHIILLFRREHYPTLLSRDIKSRIRMFTSLKTIDLDQKNQINQDLIKRYAKRLAKLYFVEDRLIILRKAIYVAVVLIFILFIGKIYYAYEYPLVFKIHNTTTSNYIKAFSPVMLFLMLYAACFNFLSDLMSFRQHLFYIGSVLLGGLYFFTALKEEYRIYIFGLVGLQILLLFSLILNSFIRQWFRQIDHKHPETIIVHNILLVMKKLDEGLLSNFYAKTMLVVRLEYAAFFFEKYMYQRLQTTDEQTNKWIKERTRQIATSLRDKKKWIYTPKPDTSQYLMRTLADFLIHFLRNEWDLLERLDIPQDAQRSGWKDQFLNVVRNLFFGVLPIATLLLLQYTKVVKTPFSDSVIGVAIIWAIVNFLWLDPATKDKVSTMKDVAGLVSSKN